MLAADSPLAMPSRLEPMVSAAERRVLRALSDGASNREVAAVLHLSVRTVEGHISRLLAKTGCRSRTQLVLWALPRT